MDWMLSEYVWVCFSLQKPRVFTFLNLTIQFKHLCIQEMQQRNGSNTVVTKKEEGCPLDQSFWPRGPDTLVYFNYLWHMSQGP